MARNITVNLIDNSGSGNSREVTVTENMTLEAFSAEYLAGRSDVLIRVNGRTVERNAEAAQRTGAPTMSTQLSNNDRVSVSPSKVQGA